MPYRGNEVVSASHALAVAYEVGEQVENLGLHINQLIVATQFAPVHVQLIIFEAKQQLNCSLTASVLKPSTPGTR